MVNPFNFLLFRIFSFLFFLFISFSVSNADSVDGFSAKNTPRSVKNTPLAQGKMEKLVGNLFNAKTGELKLYQPHNLFSGITQSRHPDSFLEKYWIYHIAFAILILSESFLLFFLYRKQKRMKDKTSQNDFILRTFFDLVPCSCTLFDYAGRYEMVNQSFLDRCGLPRDKVIGKTFQELFGYARNPELEERDRQQILKDGFIKNRSDEFIDADKKKHELLYSAQMIYLHKIPHFLTATVDISELKETQKMLKKSKDVFKQIVENLPSAIGIMNLQGKINYLNPAFSRIFGFTLEDIPTLSEWTSKAYPDPVYLNEMIQLWQKDIQNLKENLRGESPPRIYRIRTKSGNPLEIEIIFTLIDDEIYCLFHDVTAQKRAEKELIESEKRAKLHRAVIAQIVIHKSLVYLDLPGAFEYITKIIADTLGVERASIWQLNKNNSRLECVLLYNAEGKKYFSGISYDPEIFPAYFKAILSENRIYVEDAQNDPRTSELTESYLKPFNIQSMLDAGILIEGRLFGVVSCEHIGKKRKWNSDEESFISTVAAIIAQLLINAERKETERKLFESQTFLNTALMQSPSGIVIADAPDGKISFANPAAFAMRGKEDSSLLDIDFLKHSTSWNIFKTDGVTYYPTHDLPLSKAILEGQIVKNVEMIFRNENGEDRFASVSSAPIRDQQGKIVAGIVIFQDITERIKAEKKIRDLNENLEEKVMERTAQLAAANEELDAANQSLLENNEILFNTLDELKKTQKKLIISEKMAALGQLVAGIAHEINNPLGAIIASNQIISDSISIYLNKALKFYRNSQDDQVNLFDALIKKVLESNPLNKNLSDQQIRKKNIVAKLRERDLTDMNALVDELLEIGFDGKIDEWIAILKTPHSREIIGFIHSLANLVYSAAIQKTASEKISRLVKTLKTYSYHNADEKKEPTDINEQIDLILLIYYNKYKYTVKIVKKFTPVPKINLYLEKINQVWMNIINNALQAMEINGVLEIETKEENGSVIVSFTDNGPGIPVEIQNQIFTPFFTTKKSGEGTGLGLAMCKKILEEINGSIIFTSIPGKTVFTVTLPMS